MITEHFTSKIYVWLIFYNFCFYIFNFYLMKHNYCIYIYCFMHDFFTFLNIFIMAFLKSLLIWQPVSVACIFFLYIDHTSLFICMSCKFLWKLDFLGNVLFIIAALDIDLSSRRVVLFIIVKLFTFLVNWLDYFSYVYFPCNVKLLMLKPHKNLMK